MTVAVVSSLGAQAVATALGAAADLGEEDFKQMVQEEHMLRRLSIARCPLLLLPSLSCTLSS